MQQCDLVAAPGGYYNHDNILIGRHIMKKKIVRRMLLAILALGLLLGSIPAVLGAENLFDPENAFDELYLEEAEDRPGVFTNQNSANGSTGSEDVYKRQRYPRAESFAESFPPHDIHLHAGAGYQEQG